MTEYTVKNQTDSSTKQSGEITKKDTKVRLQTETGQTPTSNATRDLEKTFKDYSRATHKVVVKRYATK